MRVADRTTSRNYLKYLNQARNNYAKTNQQIFSGSRFQKLSDDVSAGTRVITSRMDKYKVEKQLDNVNTVADELDVAEDAMKAMSDLTRRAGETLLASMNDPKGESGRVAIADEIKAMKQEFLQLINTRYGKKFSFGGNNASARAPFSVGADGHVEYNGIAVDSIKKDNQGYYYEDVDGNRQPIPMDEDVYMDVGLGIPVSESQLDDSTGFKVSFSGLDIVGFGKDDKGNSNNLYNILSDIETNLRTYDKEKIFALKDKLDDRMDGFGGNLSEIGARTKMLETMQTRLESRVDSHKERISSLMGVNDAEAATQLKLDDFVLKAVLQMGSNILPLSLMDFLK